jgi:hypothetical protein
MKATGIRDGTLLVLANQEVHLVHNIKGHWQAGDRLFQCHSLVALSAQDSPFVDVLEPAGTNSDDVRYENRHGTSGSSREAGLGASGGRRGGWQSGSWCRSERTVT